MSSTRRPRGLSAEDAEVWAEVARTVRPIRRRKPATLPTGPVAESPKTAQPAPNPTAGLNNPTDIPPALLLAPTSSAAAPRITVQRAAPTLGPADRSGERRVRRGQVEIDAALDLHGFTQDQAFAALTHFLFAAHARGAAAVLVVTGKGGRARDGEAAPGVLKRRLPDWLASPGLRPVVSGMAPAHRKHGGAGASYVFLRRVRPLEGGD